MELKKYPVISKNGNKYLVELFERHYPSRLNLNIYEKVTYELYAFGLKTGKISDKFKMVGSYETRFESLKDCNEKYIELVNTHVAEYEKELEEDRKFKKRIEEFENWDGKCK